MLVVHTRDEVFYGLTWLDEVTMPIPHAAFLGYIGGGGLPRQNILKYFDRLDVINVS